MCPTIGVLSIGDSAFECYTLSKFKDRWIGSVTKTPSGEYHQTVELWLRHPRKKVMPKRGR